MYILKNPGRPKENKPYVSQNSRNREWKSFQFDSIDNPEEVLMRTKLLIERRQREYSQ